MRADALSGTPMDEDLIEPGGSGGLSPSCQPLLDPEQDETDQDKCTPYASASSLATPIVKPEEETPPSSPALPERDGGDKSKVERAAAHVPVSPLERAAIAMSRRRAMTRMKPSAPYVALSCLQALVGAVVTATGGAAFATTPTFPAGCFWAGLLVSDTNFLDRPCNFSDSPSNFCRFWLKVCTTSPCSVSNLPYTKTEVSGDASELWQAKAK